MRHRFGEVHVAAAAHFEHRVASDRAFLQAGESDDRLDRRARLEAGGECHLLIDDCEDAAGGWIHRDDRAVRMAQRVDRHLADDCIVVAGGVKFRGIQD